MKFKIGDEVSITKIGRSRWNTNDFGTGVGNVTKVESPEPTYHFVAVVQWNRGKWAFYREVDLEHTNLSLENV